MKIKTISFLVLFIFSSLVAYGQCSNCNDPNNVITNNGNGIFTATSAQEYYWEICEGNATISGSNTNQTVSVNASESYKIEVVRFNNGNCTSACEIFSLCTMVDCPSDSDLTMFFGDDCSVNVRIQGIDACEDQVSWYWDASCCGGSPSNQYVGSNLLIIDNLETTNGPLPNNIWMDISATVIFQNGVTCRTIRGQISPFICRTKP